MLRVTALLFVEHLLKESHRFLLQVFLHGRKVDPSAYRLSIQVQIVLLKALIDDLSSFFELADVPHEGGCRYQVTIVGHFLPFIHRQYKRIDGLLVDISAPFMVEYERLSRRKLNFSTVLHAC